MNIKQKALELHKQWRGKTEIAGRIPLDTEEEISLAYTPGVAEPCKEIHKDRDKVYAYTRKWNTIAIVTDGTAVLGLGDIGPEAALPVMEGKAILFKRFGDVDAISICLATKDTDEIVRTVKNLAPAFGGINLEDISAPRCFEIERRLIKEIDIPVFHDDQHGTAIVILAGLINSLKLVNKKIEETLLVINGAGAAALATSRLLLEAGVQDLILCDTKGAIYEGREGLNPEKAIIAGITNKNKRQGSLKDIIKGRDVFIGVSTGGIVNTDMIKTMNNDAIVFALANPEPEIYPEKAKNGGARIVGTGRSDFANQINNALIFPALFRGVLDVRAREVNSAMKIAAAKALAGCISDDELREDYVIPKILDPRVSRAVAEAVRESAKQTNTARN